MQPSSAPFTPQSGAGAPGASVPHNQLYFDTSSSPYTGYVYIAGAWHTFATSAGGGANATQIQGVNVDNSAPTDTQVLQYSAGLGKWHPATLLMSGAPIEQAAVNAGNFTIPDGVNFVRLTIAAGSLTTFTLKMPANPVDGQYIVWTVEKLIASLTLQANAGQTIVGVTAPGPGANQFGLLWYRLAATQWVSPGTAI